jgi:riboflavin biosynthesis pyrimidine reductase
MAGLTGALTSTVVSRLTSITDGVSVRVGAITQADPALQVAGQTVGIRTVLAQNASTDISEKAGHAHYPALLVYCDKMSNTLKEKFRRFSGKAHLVVEVRHSQDRLETIEANLQLYVDAVCALLDDSRGDWGGGSCYTGGYEVTYEPVARGGKNFLQRAKVGFDGEVSK